MGCVGGAAAGVAGGMSDVFGSLISNALSPNSPTLGSVYGQGNAYLYGTPTPGQNQTLSKDSSTISADQTKLAQLQQQLAAGQSNPFAHLGTSTKQLQNQIDQLQKKMGKTQTQQSNLQTKLGQESSNSLASNTLAAQTQYLPAFQNLANALTNTSIQQSQAAQQQYGLAGGQILQQQQQALNPEYYAANAALGQQLTNAATGGPGGTPMGLSPQQLQFFQQQFAGQQAAQGTYGSGLSAQNMALQLTPLELAQQQQNIGNLQGYLNTYQQAQLPNYMTPQQTTMQGLVGSLFTPPSAQSVYNTQAGLVNANYANGLAQANTMGSALGGLASGYDAISGAMSGMNGSGGGAGAGSGGGMGGFGSLIGMLGG